MFAQPPRRKGRFGRFCRNIARHEEFRLKPDTTECLSNVTKKLPRQFPLATPPPQHAPRMPPKHGRVPSRPSLDPVAKAPRQRPVAKVPKPRRPQVVRAATGDLGDLFDVFRDIPRPPRPAIAHPRNRRRTFVRRA